MYKILLTVTEKLAMNGRMAVKVRFSTMGDCSPL